MSVAEEIRVALQELPDRVLEALEVANAPTDAIDPEDIPASDIYGFAQPPIMPAMPETQEPEWAVSLETLLRNLDELAPFGEPPAQPDVYKVAPSPVSLGPDGMPPPPEHEDYYRADMPALPPVRSWEEMTPLDRLPRADEIEEADEPFVPPVPNEEHYYRADEPFVPPVRGLGRMPDEERDDPMRGLDFPALGLLGGGQGEDESKLAGSGHSGILDVLEAPGSSTVDLLTRIAEGVEALVELMKGHGGIMGFMGGTSGAPANKMELDWPMFADEFHEKGNSASPSLGNLLPLTTQPSEARESQQPGGTTVIVPPRPSPKNAPKKAGK